MIISTCFLLTLIVSLIFQWAYFAPKMNALNTNIDALRSEINAIDPKLKKSMVVLKELDLKDDLSNAGRELSKRSTLELMSLRNSLLLISDFGKITNIERHLESRAHRYHILMRLKADRTTEQLISKINLIGEVVYLGEIKREPGNDLLISFDLYLTRLNNWLKEEQS